MAADAEADLYGPWPKDPHDRWEPRSPSSEVLFQVVRDHLDDFLETVSLGDDGHGLPSFVWPPPLLAWPPTLYERTSSGA